MHHRCRLPQTQLPARKAASGLPMPGPCGQRLEAQVREVPVRRQGEALGAGSYPLVEAREGSDKAKKARDEGEDPVQVRRVAKVLSLTASDQNFKVVAREFFETKKRGWSPKYAARWIERRQKDLFPTSARCPWGTSRPRCCSKRSGVSNGAVETAHTLRQ